MTETIQILLLLLAVLALVGVIARRLNTAPSILLVIAGIGLALIPGLPRIELAPELVLLGILPPLIYSAGVSMSWREFRFNLRPISLLAFGCVVFTTCAVAAGAHYLLGLPWPVAFLLGAIVSPPDVVAPLSIARRLGLPRRIVVILQGEGLANDATALILFRFAVAAISTGMFSLPQAAATFGAIVVGELVYGIFIGWASLQLRRWASDPRVEITLSLMTPYLAYWVPEHLGGSGVLATVAAGLYVSWNGPLLIPSATRLQGIFFWDLLIYIIEGLVFLVTGLQARVLYDQADRFALPELLFATILTTTIVIVARFVWMFPATYVPRWVSPSLRRRDPAPNWTYPFILAFTGVRGVVSLAAALAIPFTIGSGAPFPNRDLIIFVTFGVIIITLVGQGLMLPSVVRWLGLGRDSEYERQRERQAEMAARLTALDIAQQRLQELAKERNLPDDVRAQLRARIQHRRQQLPASADGATDNLRLGAKLRSELIAAERRHLHQLLRKGQITDEARRRIERELDLEEQAILCGKDDPPL
jgi:monovalent cation/hydrogen antiporter